MSKLLKALLCDVDGVLVDTEALHFKARSLICFEATGQILTEEEHTTLVGKDGVVIMMEICRMKGCIGDATELSKLCHAQYKRLRQENIPPIEENVRLVREFQRLVPGLRFAAVSSDVHEHIRENLEVAGLKDFFELAISGHSDGIPKKPAPDMWLAAMRKLGVTPDESLAIEDSPTGVESVIRAGVRVVALPSSSSVSCDFPGANLLIKPGERKSAEDILKRLLQ